MSQIGLPLEWPAEVEKSDFLIGESNRAAADFIEHWSRWPVAACVLVGPRKSGRTLLGRIFGANTRGTVIDDAETHAEASIFHAWNNAQTTRAPLLIIADATPGEWRVQLPDLKSRLSATPFVEIAEPDLELCEQLLAHILGRRNMLLPADVAKFISARMERSYVSIQRIVDALDERSLSAQRALTIPFVREVLRERGIIARR